MGVADGHILGTHKMVDRGPSSARWDLVIMGDGYQAGPGLVQFKADATALSNALLATPPFSSLTAAINVFRMDVESVGTGVREPPACGGSGTRFRTYLEASLCGDQRLKRYLVINKALAVSAANLHVPGWNQIIVIVNTPIYGGAALGGVATCTKDPLSWHIAMHELGHNLGLADEYEEHTQAYPLTWLTPEPNVSRLYAPLKWQSRVAPSTPIPTGVNPACGGQGPTAAAAPGIYGAFEGGKRYTCGIYRPSLKCKMRTLTDPFCAVCQDHIRAKLQPFMPHT